MPQDASRLIWIDLEMTGLSPERDRIIEMALVVTDVDLNAVYENVKQVIMVSFAEGYSKALQQDLFKMAAAVIDSCDEIDEIKFSCPNKHHFLPDLSFFGLDNPGEVFYAADRPYGLIEATIQRKGSATADEAWAGVAGFC